LSGCAGCALCCKVLEIVDLQPKPSPCGEWCGHAEPGRSPGACTIYEARPESCRAFACLWLLSQDRPDDVMAPELRPDRSKAVLTAVPGQNTLLVHPDPAYPDAWRRGALKHLVHNFLESGGRVIVVHKATRQVLTLRETRP
jgi:uncharacterized protein